MNREFLLNISLLLLVNLLIKPFYVFGIERTVQNEVPPGDYGLYFALFNLTLVFQIIGDLGIQNFNNRHLSQHPFLLSKYFPAMLFLKSLLFLGYFALVCTAAWASGYELAVFPLLLPIAFNQMLNSLLLFFRSNLAGLALYRTDSFISVLDRLLLILICGTIFITSPRFKIEWFVYAQTASMSLTVLIAFLSFKNYLTKLRFRINWALSWLILQKSFPYALSVMLMGTYMRLDGFLVERLLPDGKLEAAVYASAYRLLDVCNMLGFLFAGLLLPMFARLLKERQSVEPLLKLGFQLIVVIAITVVTASVCYRHEIMLALYDEATAYSGAVLGCLMLSFVPFSIIYVYGPLLTANQNLRALNRLFVIAVIVNLGLNVLLIPTYKALGAAAVAVGTQMLVAIGQMWLAHRKLKIRIPIGILIRLLMLTIINIALAVAMSCFFKNNWLIGFGLLGILGAASALPLGLIQKNLFFELLPSKRP
jgi:O-antigen/teichoic acid export membrane protein